VRELWIRKQSGKSTEKKVMGEGNGESGREKLIKS